MATIGVHEVTKVFGEGVVAVDNVSLELGDGEFMVLVGPSGCGKTTLLRMIAGLEEVTRGRLTIGSRDVTYVPPRSRDIAMVFQDYALYPFMTVEENLAFGLKLRKTPRGEIERRVADAARILGLETLLKRRPSQLSGGQRQRVAMGRAIVREPQAFLMDEPLSNLDAALRVGMRAELARLRDRLKTTTVYVTHDQVEAMTLGDRVAVLRGGVLQQVDAPQNLFRRPANLFVAVFIGSPAMNLVEARVEGDVVSFAGFKIPLPRAVDLPRTRDNQVILGIRPSAFEDAELGRHGDLPAIEVTAEVVEALGDVAHVIFSIDAPRVDTEEVRSAQAAAAAGDDPDEMVLVHDEHMQTATFSARVDGATRAQRGSHVRLAVDPAAFYFFDPDTGTALAAPAAPGDPGLSPAVAAGL